MSVPTSTAPPLLSLSPAASPAIFSPCRVRQPACPANSGSGSISPASTLSLLKSSRLSARFS